MKLKKQATLELVRLCCRALDDKKASELRVLDVSAQSSITDYLIVATATSEPHLRALRIELEKVIDSSKTKILGIETAQESGWTVIDLFDLMVHLFSADKRAQYGLENLWKDSSEVSVVKLLAAVKPKLERKAAPLSRKKRATKK
jgi:ribosome-associated protein